MEQQSPPGYAMLLSSWEEAQRDDFLKEDVDRIRSLPDDAMQSLRQYMEQLLAGKTREDQVCIWLDRQTRKCKYHDSRPSICREFEMGSEECREWREEFNIS